MSQIILLLLSGCGPLPHEAEVYDFCDPETDTGTGGCLPCASDDECTLTGSACMPNVCAHRDDAVPVPDDSCVPDARDYWPDPAGCRCLDDRCTWSP